MPSITRFALVTGTTAAREARQEVENAGRALGVDIVFVPVSDPHEFDAAPTGAKRDGATGIIVVADPLTFAHRQQFVQLAVKHRLPGIYWDRSYVEDGGLMTYSANPTELRRRAAHYVDRIPDGSKTRRISPSNAPPRSSW